MDPNPIRPTRGKARGRPQFASTPATRGPPPILTNVQGIRSAQPSQASQSTQQAQQPIQQAQQPTHSTQSPQSIHSTQPSQQPLQQGVGLNMQRPPRQMPPRLPGGPQQRAPRPPFAPRHGGSGDSSSQQNPMLGVSNYL